MKTSEKDNICCTARGRLCFLAQAFTQSLETLNLGHNNLTNEGMHRLKDGLLQNQSLLRFGLQSTKISCEGQSRRYLFIVR